MAIVIFILIVCFDWYRHEKARRPFLITGLELVPVFADCHLFAAAFTLRPQPLRVTRILTAMGRPTETLALDGFRQICLSVVTLPESQRPSSAICKVMKFFSRGLYHKSM
jgi:hypothetical protein